MKMKRHDWKRTRTREDWGWQYKYQCAKCGMRFSIGYTDCDRGGIDPDDRITTTARECRG